MEDVLFIEIFCMKIDWNVSRMCVCACVCVCVFFFLTFWTTFLYFDHLHRRSMGPSGGPFVAVVVGPAATGSCNFCFLRSPLDQESEAAFASQPCRRAVQHGWPSRCNWKSILEGAQLSPRTHYSSREELIAPYTSPPLCLLFQIWNAATR